MTHAAASQNLSHPAGDKKELYAELARQAAGLFEGERDLIANAANLSSLIATSLPGLNWAGFYFLKEGELVLGPFQGKPACVRIALGKGVCGTAALRKSAIRVDDVDTFPGHIACDAESRSEVVIPLLRGNDLIGVLDLDSSHRGRFDDEDVAGLTELATVLMRT